MTTAETAQLLTAEVRWANDAGAILWVGSAPIHQFWPLLAPYFSESFLPPQRRPGGDAVAWTWQGSPSAVASAGELAALRAKLSADLQSFGAGQGKGKVAESDESSQAKKKRENLAMLLLLVEGFVGEVLGKPDAELARYVAVTEAGPRLHSWGAKRPAKPLGPEQLGREVAGTAVRGGKPVAGAEVLLEAVEGGFKVEMRTDEAGEFRFSHIARGKYRLTARHDTADFAEAGVDVNVEGEAVTGLKLRAAHVGVGAATGAAGASEASSGPEPVAGEAEGEGEILKRKRRIRPLWYVGGAAALGGAAWLLIGGSGEQSPKRTQGSLGSVPASNFAGGETSVATSRGVSSTSTSRIGFGGVSGAKSGAAARSTASGSAQASSSQTSLSTPPRAPLSAQAASSPETEGEAGGTGETGQAAPTQTASSGDHSSAQLASPASAGNTAPASAAAGAPAANPGGSQSSAGGNSGDSSDGRGGGSGGSKSGGGAGAGSGSQSSAAGSQSAPTASAGAEGPSSSAAQSTGAGGAKGPDAARPAGKGALAGAGQHAGAPKPAESAKSPDTAKKSSAQKQQRKPEKAVHQQQPPSNPAKPETSAEPAKSPVKAGGMESGSAMVALAESWARRVRVRTSDWRVRLLVDPILPTMPDTGTDLSTSGVEALRQKLLAEQRAKIPAIFRQVAGSRGIVIEWPAAQKVASSLPTSGGDAAGTGATAAPEVATAAIASARMHWVIPPGSGARGTVKVTDAATATAIAPTAATLITAAAEGGAGRAELSWPERESLSAGTYTLVDAAGAPVAQLQVAAGQTPVFAAKPQVNARCWFEVNVMPGAGNRFEWRRSSGAPAPAAWRQSAAGSALRVEVPIVSNPGQVLAERVALLDSQTGWALTAVVDQTSFTAQ